MDKIHLVLSAADGKRWEKQVSSVTLPGVKGSLGILAGHAPMLCALEAGVMGCRSEDGQVQRLRISEGVASVADNEVTLLLEDLELLE